MMDNLEELIPDFDQMEEFARQAAELSAQIVVVKHALSMKEAEVVRDALTNKDYWIGNKQPSMSYCDKVVSKLGNTDADREELSNLREQLADLVQRSEMLQHIISLGRDKLDLYRTISANERKGFL